MGMCERDITKIEEILKKPVKECFTYMSYMKDYNKELDKEQKRIQSKNKVR